MSFLFPVHEISFGEDDWFSLFPMINRLDDLITALELLSLIGAEQDMTGYRMMSGCQCESECG